MTDRLCVPFCGFEPEPRFLGRVRSPFLSGSDPEPDRYVGFIDRCGKLLAVGCDEREAFSRLRSLDVSLSRGLEKASVSAAEYRAWWEGLAPERQARLSLGGGCLPP
jgi:hypothetical protein